MRCALCTIAVCLLVGCQSQSMPVTNPFMSPDRVPPPSTRTLAPGTAQPYYPGDPTPNLQPGAVVPPNYPPANVIPPVTPAPPAGNWNPQPPPQHVNPASAELPIGPVASVNESPVQIQSDQQGLRFNTPEIQNLANVAPVAQAQQVVPAQFEDVLPTSQPWESVTSVPVTEVVPRDVSIRAVSSPGSESLSNASGFRSPSGDGFRPQGSSRQGNVSAETVNRFGFDPQYRWLRGQLEFDPTSQQWYLRYISQVGQPDQHGGRLLVANPIVLGDLQPGAHVQVQGRLDGRQVGPATVVPIYTISAVQRQR